MSSRRQKIHQTMSEHFVPENGTFGDVWVAKAEQTFWYATRDGVVVNLSDVLNNIPAHTPPRHGRAGIDGAAGRDGSPGRTGSTGVGLPGAAGRDGNDGAVGPQGRSGKDGAPGRDAPAREELNNIQIEHRRELAALRSEFDEVKASLAALLDRDKRGADYVDFLKSRIAART